MPMLFGGSLLTFWLIAAVIYRLSLNEALKNFAQTQIITITFLLSSIINTLADFVNCTTLNKEDFNVSYLSIQCTNNSNYLFWRNFLIFPSFLFYVILLPMTAFVYMFKNRMNLFDVNIVAKISFLLQGYKRESYYWWLLFFSNQLFTVILF